MERSGPLFQDDDTLLWLKEIIGYTLNKIDAGEVTDKDILIAQLHSGVLENHFSWSRYRLTLKTADFMDDLTIVAPQDLMMGGQEQAMPMDAGVQEQLDPELGQAQNAERQAHAEQQINQMINQL